MGTKNIPGMFDCYKELADDEPHFVLKSTDRSAPYLVRIWTAVRECDPIKALEVLTELLKKEQTNYVLNPTNPEKIMEAAHVADEMELWVFKQHAKSGG
jgi:hypothetical protein